MPSHIVKYKRSGTRAGRNKKYITKSRHAKAQQHQLMSLQKQVNTIKRNVKDISQYAQYQSALVETGLDHNWTVVQMMRPDTWGEVFQSTTETNNSNKFRLRHLAMEMFFSINNTELPLGPQVVTFFLCSLRKETAAKTINDLGGIGLPNINTAGLNKYFTRTDFGGGTYQGLCKLNPSVFKIHKVKRFQIQNILNWVPGTDDQLTSVASDTQKRIYFKLRRGNVIKSNSVKRWKQMEQEDCEQTDLLYVMVNVSGAANSTESPPLALAFNATFSGRLAN